MPRTKQIEKQDILGAAAEVVRQKGEQALTVRNIAAQLGCSTQPHALLTGSYFNCTKARFCPASS